MACKMLDLRYVACVRSERSDRHGVETMDYQIIAESNIHPGRRLLVGCNGDGYIQLAIGAEPIAMEEHDFVRLLVMRHYRLVPAILHLDRFAPFGLRDQVAD